VILEKAYAKINLGLDVVRRLPNGYHELNMVMQTIDLYDELTLSKTESGITVHTGLDELPGDESNLIYKAAKLIVEETGLSQGVDISLKKRIPMAAGMAGGSADAAATLRGMNRLYNLGISEDRLCELGVKIGADVPYCVVMGTKLSQGIGEKLTELPRIPEAFVLIAKPGISVSTKYVFEHLKLDSDTIHPDMGRVVDCIEAGDLRGMCTSIGNVLETVTAVEYPVISEIEECMKSEGALVAMMSGSGPTVFGIFDDSAKADNALKTINEKGIAKDLLVTGFYYPD